MNNHILVLSRHDFKKFVSGLTPEQKESYAFISIHEPIGHTGKEMFGGSSETILDSAHNVLNLWFDDAEEEIPLNHQLWRKFGVENTEADEMKLFNEDMANTIFEFVKANENAKGWILHCTAGINRSGAVGGFLADYFGINYLEFKGYNPQVVGNSLVKKLLTRKLLENFDN